jgi:hypothetical protein
MVAETFIGGRMRAVATYTVKRWEETTYLQISPRTKLTRATVEFAFSGDMEGMGFVEYLMFYRHFDAKDQHKSRASYVGLMRFEGVVAGRSGSFIMKDTGAFEGGAAVSVLQIDAESGTGRLEGITGSGLYRADQKGFHFEMDFNFADTGTA